MSFHYDLSFPLLSLEGKKMCADSDCGRLKQALDNEEEGLQKVTSFSRKD